MLINDGHGKQSFRLRGYFGQEDATSSDETAWTPSAEDIARVDAFPDTASPTPATTTDAGANSNWFTNLLSTTAGIAKLATGTTPAAKPAAGAAANIMGLPPTIFYVGLGAVALVGVALVLKKKK